MEEINNEMPGPGYTIDKLTGRIIPLDDSAFLDKQPAKVTQAITSDRWNPFDPAAEPQSYQAHEKCSYLYDTNYEAYLDCFYREIDPNSSPEEYRKLYPEQYKKAAAEKPKPEAAKDSGMPAWAWILIAAVAVLVAVLVLARWKKWF